MEYGSRSLDAAIGLFSEALEGGDMAPAVDAFGTRRGVDGVALAASLDDLSTVHRIVAGEEPSGLSLRRFAIAWSEAAHGTFIARGALDHTTGLATTDYLATRLRDLARSSECAGRRLVVAEGPDPSTPRFPTMLRSARVARELADSFPQSETPIGLSLGRVAVIAPEDEAFEANLVRARIAIRAIDGGRRTAVEPIGLPDAVADVRAFITTV